MGIAHSSPVGMRGPASRMMVPVARMSSSNSYSTSNHSSPVGLPGQSHHHMANYAPAPTPNPPPMYESYDAMMVMTESATVTMAATTHAASTAAATTTTTPTTTTTTTAGHLQLSSYLDLTNLQAVDGKWSLMSVQDFLATDHLMSLHRLAGNPDDIATVVVIVMLHEHFGNEKQDWSASADKAWDATTFKSRMAARSLVRQVISVFGYNLSVFDVLA